MVGHCPSNKFDCGNEECIDLDWRCDGHNHCGNNADEERCEGTKSIS